jgi:hypothetical protein
MKSCVLHPNRDGTQRAQGIAVCPECFLKYRDERKLNLEFKQRVFFRELLAARHGLTKKAIAERAAFILCVASWILAVSLY